MAKATVTQVLWNEVIGAHLEELLYGLLDAMGASSLTWRAGSASGVTAADGGRDLEAVFDRPSPDGELDRQRWWIESKGRKETVERSVVQQTILDASARTDVDILVIATNSRFSNPTRDWVAERSRSHARPLIKLWDRDNLDRLVRQYPTVAARVLPSTLSDDDRLRLLVARFEELGEEPTLLDLEFFWERRSWLKEQDSGIISHAVAMFLFAEGVSVPRQRRWWELLKEEDAPVALIMALVVMPSLVSDPRPRPLELIRVLASAGRILITCLLLMPDQIGLKMTLNPWRYIIGAGHIADDKEEMEAWRESTLSSVLSFVQSDLLNACSSDCARVSGDDPHGTSSLSAKEYWNFVFGVESKASNEFLIVIEDIRRPCTVGLDVTSGCPLVVSNQIDVEQILQGVQAVLRFRKTSPDGVVEMGHLPEDRGPWRLTVLEERGLSWRMMRFSESGQPEAAQPASQDEEAESPS